VGETIFLLAGHFWRKNKMRLYDLSGKGRQCDFFKEQKGFLYAVGNDGELIKLGHKIYPRFTLRDEIASDLVQTFWDERLRDIYCQPMIDIR
jgi:hypothetical protein